MAFVAVAGTVGAAVGLGGTAAIIGGGALIGAGVGGAYSAITGDGNILNSMLTGGLIGGAGAFGLNALGVGAGATSASGLTGGGAFVPTAGSGASFVAPTAAQAGSLSPALASQVLTGANTSTGAALANASADPIMAAANMSGMTEGQLAAMNVPAGASPVPTGLTGKEMLGYGLAGTAALSLLGSQNQSKLPSAPVDPGQIRPYTYSTTTNQSAYPTGPQYGANGLPILPKNEQNFFNQSYTAGTPYTAANGGLMSIGGPVERMSQNMMGGHGNMYPLSQQEHTYFATPTQMPAYAEVIRSDYDSKTDPYTGVMMSNGGMTDYNLGDYSDGGRLLKGPGDGVSDDIPAVIGNKQPARLADGEFVIPARIVSELGNGSTDAGAKRLYAMMDNIQAGRKKTVGKDKVAKDTKAKKHLLA